ncbi:MAG TPA: BON domain-containing protein [Nitrospira sp.]
MTIGWIGLLVIVLGLPAAARAAENGSPSDRPKEAAPAPEPKKKETDSGVKSSEEKSSKEEKADKTPPKEEKSTKEEKSLKEDKPAKEDKASKEEKPAKEEKSSESQPKQEEAKKPVTSPNLTIKLALMADPLLFPFEIEVEMDNRKAVLTGTVSDEDGKIRAADIVQKLDGIESVVNKLSVSPAVRTSLAKKQDETIAHFVKERLAKSETLKAVGFDVKAENGVVQLSGKTRFQVIALEAAEAARQVPGVRAVNTTGVQIIGKE